MSRRAVQARLGSDQGPEVTVRPVGVAQKERSRCAVKGSMCLVCDRRLAPFSRDRIYGCLVGRNMRRRAWNQATAATYVSQELPEIAIGGDVR